MSVKIRLRRMGNNNRPFYRVVATDSRCAPSGRFLENLGWYDPTGDRGRNFNINMDRVSYWRDNGAQMSDTVKNIVKIAAKQPAQPAEPAPAAPEAAAEAPAEAPVEETAPAAEEAAPEATEATAEDAKAAEEAETEPEKAEEKTEEPAESDAEEAAEETEKA